MEDTLTWGKGLGSLESAQEDSSRHEDAAVGQTDRRTDSDSDERFRRPVAQGSQDQSGQSSDSSGDRDRDKVGTDHGEAANHAHTGRTVSRKSPKPTRGSNAVQPKATDEGRSQGRQSEELSGREQDGKRGGASKGLAHDERIRDRGQGSLKNDDKANDRRSMKNSSAKTSDSEQRFKRPDQPSGADVSSPAEPTGKSNQDRGQVKQDGAKSSKQASKKSKADKKVSTSENHHGVEPMGAPPAPPAPPEAPKAARKSSRENEAPARDEHDDKKKAAR